MNKVKKFFGFLFIVPILLNACNPLPSNGVSENESSVVSSSSEDVYYEVTWFNEYGDELATTDVKAGDTPFFLYIVESTMQHIRTLFGWSLTYGGEIVKIMPASADISYYAVVYEEVQRYTLTFNTNGGSVISEIEEDYGTTINKPEDPVKEDHTFIHWTYDEELKKMVTWPLTIKADITVYAMWGIDSRVD